MNPDRNPTRAALLATMERLGLPVLDDNESTETLMAIVRGQEQAHDGESEAA